MTYDIIHLNGEQYAVIHGDNIKIPNNGYFILGGDKINQFRGTGKRYTTHLSRMIVATSDKKLGLPLLPPIEFQSTTNSASGSYHNIHTLEARISGIGQFMETNKNCAGNEEAWGKILRSSVKELVAASQKKYSEEDIRKAFQAGAAYDNYCWGISNRLGYEKKPSEDAYIQSLSPKPTKVELEMTCGVKRGSCDCSEQDIDCQFLIPNVDKDNFVTVKQWIYE